MPTRRTVLAALAAIALVGLAACGSGGGGSSDASSAGTATITLYNGQHESTTNLLVAGFTKATGIHVRVRSGEDPELANLLLQEGSASPADVIYTENSPALVLLDGKGKLAKLPASVLDQIPARYRASDGTWVGVAGREAVLAYNPWKLPASDLPASLLDVGASGWHGTVGYAPSDADFQAIVASVIEAKGTAAARQWLENLKRVGKTYNGNTAVMQAVNRGDIDAGIVYHYYWFRDRAESGANSGHVELHYFTPGDPGAFLSVSGTGVLRSSKHTREAEQLVQYLTGEAGQRALAASDDFEYPLNPNVAANPKLVPLDRLGPVQVDADAVGNGRNAVDLLQQVGIL